MRQAQPGIYNLCAFALKSTFQATQKCLHTRYVTCDLGHGTWDMQHVIIAQANTSPPNKRSPLSPTPPLQEDKFSQDRGCIL